METKETHVVEDAFGRNNPQEPNWVTGDMGSYPCGPFSPMMSESSPTGTQVHKPVEVLEPVQQSDLLKPFLVDITNYGLNYAYHKYKLHDPGSYKHTQTKKPKHVIVVGAGMAGLVAAYELAQAGHTVTILEKQMRYGGRVKTFGEKDGFAKGQHVDAGAMRLPCRVDDPNKVHFLTDHYVDQFKLKTVPFVNYDENTFLKFYNMKAVQIKDWNNSYFDSLWPGWDKRIKKTGAKKKYNIEDIGSYYKQTTGVVTDQLREWLAEDNTEKGAADIWRRWIKIWSQFPLDGFLESTCAAVLTKVRKHLRAGLCEKLEELIPWPQEAITAYSIFSYTLQLDQSLVQYLRDDLGEWWSDNMHHIEGGMSQLPEAFTKRNKHGWNKDVHIQRDIYFNRTVSEVKYTFESKPSPVKNQVKVTGYFSTSGQCFEVEGDAVIVTTPINVIRQIRFSSADRNTPEPSQDFYKAIEDIWTGPSTKIMIQTKTRFWESKYNIKGGFTKTNLPIGQIHYPSNTDGQIHGKHGILLVYTWKSEALLFGSLDPDVAVKEAVKEIAIIHPEIEDEFEVGAVQAWYNDPAAQGAYALLKPHQFHNVEWLMNPMCNVFFAGEGISFANAWIQGALESGLRAAYQFFARNENDA